MGYGLVLDDDVRVAAWVYSTYKMFPIPVNRAYGLVETDGTLVGAALLQNYNGVNIELSYYGPWTLSLGLVREIIRLGVTEFNVGRATVLTSKKNKRLIKSLLRFGWRFEGVQRCFYGHRDCTRNTAVRFVMFREQLDRIGKLPSTSIEQGLKHGH